MFQFKASVVVSDRKLNILGLLVHLEVNIVRNFQWFSKILVKTLKSDGKTGIFSF